MKFNTLIVFFCFLLFESVYTQGTLKSTEEEKIKEDRKGCCMIQYKAGGFDYYRATEKDCKGSKHFYKFISEKTSLCFESLDSKN